VPGAALVLAGIWMTLRDAAGSTQEVAV
jgi:hypothetical protein